MGAYEDSCAVAIRALEDKAWCLGVGVGEDSHAVAIRALEARQV